MYIAVSYLQVSVTHSIPRCLQTENFNFYSCLSSFIKMHHSPQENNKAFFVFLFIDLSSILTSIYVCAKLHIWVNAKS